MKFEATISHNLDELTLAQIKTSQAAQKVVDSANNTAISQSLAELNDALKEEENVTLRFGVDFKKVDDAPAPVLVDPVNGDSVPTQAAADSTNQTAAGTETVVAN